MKKIYSSLLLAIVACLPLLTSCEDDRSSNPVVNAPTEFFLNSPSAANTEIDLASSKYLILTCTQPNYGIPVAANYYVQVAFDLEMTDYIELPQAYTSAKIKIDAEELASKLTLALVEQKGKTEADFPMDLAVYFRLRATMPTVDNTEIEGTEILSNVVSYNNINLRFSLPAVSTPDNIYVTGKFCGWDWSKSVSMAEVHNGVEAGKKTGIFWHIVYIDNDQGIKFNIKKEWNGTEVGYAGLNSIGGDKAAEIKDNGGNIASTVGAWYLMVVNSSVVGRDIVYDADFYAPEVWLMGTTTPTGGWDEKMDGCLFTIPTTMDGEFESPAFAHDADASSGVRSYVIVPTHAWWCTEFMVSDGVVEYRGNGDDQPRVTGSAGQKLYVNFGNDTGRIE